MPAPIGTIREALATYIKHIKTANGYLTNTTDSLVFNRFLKKIVANKKDGDYPKVFVVVDDGKFTRQPSNRSQDDYAFLVIYICRASADDQDASVIAENFVEDLRRLLSLSDTLGGIVQDADLVQFSTDSGFTHPEGVAVCRVEVTQFTTN